jgi:hypothetical protein
MGIGRLYPVAVALVVGAMLGAVSVGWGTLGAAEDDGNGAKGTPVRPHGGRWGKADAPPDAGPGPAAAG